MDATYSVVWHTLAEGGSVLAVPSSVDSPMADCRLLAVSLPPEHEVRSV